MFAHSEEEKVKNAENQIERFQDFRFGIGISALNVGDAINDVSLDANGAIFVKERRDVQAAIMFESHKFFTVEKFPNFGFGPFVAASLSDEEGANPLSKFGAGVLVGWRRPNTKYSWNVGLAWVVDTDALVLRDGLADGMMTDITDSANLTRTTDREGIMLIFSAAW